MFETSPPNTSRKPSHSDTESPQLTDQFGPIRCTDALSSAATVTSAMASIERWTCAASLWMDNTTALVHDARSTALVGSATIDQSVQVVPASSTFSRRS